VFTNVLSFLPRESLLDARKLGKKVSQIAAGNLFQDPEQGALHVDLDEDILGEEAIKPFELLKNVSSLSLSPIDMQEEQILRL